MYLDEDMERIGRVIRSRLEKGWLEGDPETLSVRPLARARRHYQVEYATPNGRLRWEVDASTDGVVLTEPMEPRDGGDRPDVLVSIILRVLRKRLPHDRLHRELARVRESARAEGFDFPTLYHLAVRQASWLPEDAEGLLAEIENKGLARAA